MALLPDPLHPAIVHFPIALTFAVLVLELLALSPRFRSWVAASPPLLSLAAMGSVAAVLSGEAAEDAAVIPQAARQLVEQHEELGKKVMVALLLLAAVRWLFFRLDRFATWVRVIFLLLLLVVAAAVGYNGKLGGELVFQHGVGTIPGQALAAPAPGGPTDED